MALIDHGQYRPYTDDYRACLTSPNQPPIAYRIEGLHFKRLRAFARAGLANLVGWGRALYCAIRAVKYCRLQRELMWHGIPYSYLLEDQRDSTPEHATRDGERESS